MIQIVNTQLSPWPKNFQVMVVNNNPFPTPPLRFDGVDIDFPPGEAVLVGPEQAFFLFAVESRYKEGNRITRDKTYGKVNNNDISFYEEAMQRYGCANTQQGREWFANFDFAIAPLDKKFGKKTFEELKKSQGGLS